MSVRIFFKWAFRYALVSVLTIGLMLVLYIFWAAIINSDTFGGAAFYINTVLINILFYFVLFRRYYLSDEKLERDFSVRYMTRDFVSWKDDVISYIRQEGYQAIISYAILMAVLMGTSAIEMLITGIKKIYVGFIFLPSMLIAAMISNIYLGFILSAVVIFPFCYAAGILITHKIWYKKWYSAKTADTDKGE